MYFNFSQPFYCANSSMRENNVIKTCITEEGGEEEERGRL